MFTLKDLPAQVDPDLLALLVKAEPATIGHFRHEGFMDPDVRALLPDRRIAGTAVTIRFAGMDSTIVHYALSHIRPGDVLVMDRMGDRRHAACGGGVAFAAREAGAVGIIIDGPATDIAELREYGLPVWARGLSAVTGKRQYTHGEFCVPISCGGVTVHPGDAVLADENGVLVLPASEIEPAANRAIAMQLAEKKTLARVAAGEKIADINGTNQRIREVMEKAAG
ncbi:4-hydroxy-4-methyl-2-oxoglutarate aldolase [Agaricicola taiwanensis]|uniref:Putative 4-hydroxy-4-methyl-2-oxoglutarate aldolase n=1 Tax=Agaricicola taiwanensis TaxID=591372 RepID=A0A8J2VIP6_9RHOB|nr:RraA family protein [Agaricicola taiwanensis]GGE31879.1 4-hydroxy-4-methyl-2-oxoglutarate aldolase [Agaricicola taiwanensis]